MVKPVSIFDLIGQRSEDAEGGCREWTYARSSNGYGVVGYKGKIWRAHRLLATALYGPIPDGIDVCHRCHNRACVRPTHLFLGTRQDNMDSSREAGRLGKKLDAHQIRLIRGLLQSQKPGVANVRFNTIVGAQFGVSYKTIEYIKSGAVASGVGML